MSPDPDIIGAIVTYLLNAMRADLQSATGVTQVFADYAPETNADGSLVQGPYAIVMDGPETYDFSSNDPNTGFLGNVTADGVAHVAFLAGTKALARSLGIACIHRLTDTTGDLYPADGSIMELRPSASSAVSPKDIGVDQPGLFCRIVTVHYKYQFLV